MAEEPKPIKTERIDNPDGTYIIKEKYDSGIFGPLICKSYYNNGGLISQKYKLYLFYLLPLTVAYVKIYYNEDNTYTKKTTASLIFNMFKYQSAIEIFDINNNKLSGKVYKDNKFLHLFSDKTIEHKENNNYTEHIKYTEINKNGWLSEIEEYNSDGVFISGKYYYDNNFIELGLQEYREYNDNGGYTKKYIHQEPQKKDGHMSCISVYDKNDNLLTQIHYRDNNFQEILSRKDRTYILPNIKIDKKTFSEEQNYGYSSFVSQYEDNKLVSTKYYKDNNFLKLLSSEQITYKKNGYINKVSLEETPLKDIYSCIDFYNDKNQKIKAKFYNDKNFSELAWTMYTKYFKNGEIIKLEIYCNSEEGFFSKIEKIDAKNNSVYKKHYKFKGTLAHILFWLAR